jgi:hypothetical protein
MSTDQLPKKFPPSRPENNNSVAYDYIDRDSNLRHKIVRSELKGEEKL